MEKKWWIVIAILIILVIAFAIWFFSQNPASAGERVIDLSNLPSSPESAGAAP